MTRTLPNDNITTNGTTVFVQWLEKYYIYNNSGSLNYIISPKGIATLSTNNWALSQSILDQYVHQFVYDALGRLVEKKVPGQAPLYYCYDRLDRLVLMQDGNTRSANKWIFLKYDRKGRPVMQGLYTNTTYTTRPTLQLNVIDPLYALDTDLYYEDRGTALHGYTNQSFPTTGTEIHTVNYYDNYDFDSNGGDDFVYLSQGLPNENTPTNNIFGLPTGSKRLILDGGATWLYNYTFYDVDGHVIQTQSNNHLSTTVDNITTNVYDFEGKLLTSKTYHKASVGKETTTMNRLQYDQAGRSKAIFSSSSEPISQAGQVVQWGNVINLTVNGNVLTKVGGVHGLWDAAALSLQSIPANRDGWVEFMAGEVNTHKMMGLSNGDSDPGYNTINYAFFPSADGMLYVYENGQLAASGLAGYATTDILRVERVGTSIVYKKNGVILFTSSTPFSGILYPDCTFYGLNASIKNITIGVGQWTSITNVAINGNTLTKTGGVDGTWDAGAFSLQSIPANTNGWVEFSAGELNTNKMMGLSNTDGGITYETINYAIYPAADGNVWIFENGTYKTWLGTYTPSNKFRVERQGSSIIYRNNDMAYTSLISSTGDLHADCSFYSVNASIKNVALGIGEIQLASYQYNELGQLVDKKLHSTDGTNFLQSLDYRYNLQGKLTSINNAQLTSDALTNDDTNDMFGLELLYQNNETGLTATNEVSYNGNISAIKWKGAGATAGAADQKSYKFTYDASDKLKNATSQLYNGSTWTKEANALNENLTYDHNGNIQTLVRNQRKYQFTGGLASYTNETIDNLTYSYNSAVGDQLQKVTDAASGTVTAGFNNGTSGAGNDYVYDTNGNLTQDLNKGISKIVYNHLGKPDTITFADGHHVDYTYDAAGSKLTVKTYNTSNALQTTTDYVNSFVYENGTLSFFSSPEGRVVNNSGALEYQYSIADHQGNTRIVFTSATPTPQTVTATYETTAQTNEANSFNNYPATSGINPVNTNNHTSGGTKSQYLNGGYNGMIGVTKSYAVYPGDKVKIEAYARYDAPTSNGSGLTGFATALLNAFNVMPPVPGEVHTLAAALNSYGSLEATGWADGTTDNTDPKAFVNIILFDKNYNFLDVSFAQVNSSGSPGYITANYTVKEAGYAYLYISNEQPTQTDVYFDDVTMTYTPTNIIQYNEYYPYGLQASTSWTRDNSKNNFLYNEGSEINTTTNWYDLEFRNYDAAIGRMMQIDPMATVYASQSGYHYSGNNPVMLNDPTGAYYNEGFLTPQEFVSQQEEASLAQAYDALGMGHLYADRVNTANYMANVSAQSGQSLQSFISSHLSFKITGTSGFGQDGTSKAYGSWIIKNSGSWSSGDGGLFWNEFNKSDLLEYTQRQCNCTGGTLENEAGKIFENTFNAFMGSIDPTYRSNEDRFDTKIPGRQTVIPDGIATSQVLLNASLTVVPNGSWYEVKATTSTITSSSFGNQAGGMVKALQLSNPVLAAQGVLYLTFATTHDASLSNRFVISAKIQTGVNVGQYKAMFRVMGGTPMITFYSTAASSAFMIKYFSPFRPSVPLALGDK